MAAESFSASTPSIKCIDCGGEIVRPRNIGPKPKRCALCKRAETNRLNLLRYKALKDGAAAVDPSRSCDGCGRPPVTGGKRGRAPRLCPECIIQNRRQPKKPKLSRTCLVCSKKFYTSQPKARFCCQKCAIRAQTIRNRGKLSKHLFTCKGCGTNFHPRRPDRAYCSRTCARKHQPKPAPRPKKETIRPAISKVWCVTCEQCKQPFVTRMRRATCTDSCRRLLYAARQRLRNRPKPKKERDCAECGSTFHASGQRRFCSPAHAKKHSKRIQKAKRRAREKLLPNENVNPFAVFKRDGWTCKLCGCATPRLLRGTNDPRAPELDHITPLALGGHHTYANTQCTCRACNGAKGATVVPIAA